MWGRALAVSGGTIILVFAVALWYYDHQKNISIISNWQKNYNSLMTDKNRIMSSFRTCGLLGKTDSSSNRINSLLRTTVI